MTHPISGTDTFARFRPATKADFSQYAKNLGHLTGLPLQPSQELLAQVYGYADLHELQEVLKQSGLAGPYEDEQDLAEGIPADLQVLEASGLAPHEVPREAQVLLNEAVLRRDARLVDLASEAIGARADGWLKSRLCCAAGLFCRPPVHRQAVTALKKALQSSRHLEIDFALQRAVLRGHVASLDNTHFRINEASIDAFGAPPPMRVTTLTPTDAVRQQRAWFACRRLAYYVSVEAEDHPLLEQIETFSGDADDPEALVPPLGDLLGGTSDWDESWAGGRFAKVYPGYSEVATDGEKAAFEQWHEDLHTFVQAPSAELAQGHPLLRLIPDPVEFARSYASKRFCENVIRVCDPRDAEDLFVVESEVAGREVTMALSIKASGESADGSLPLQMFDFHASFWSRDPASRDDRQQAVAVLIGTHVKLVDEEDEAASDEMVLDSMDAHSQLLNDAWRAVTYEFLPKTGSGSLEEHVAELDPSDAALAVLEVEQRPGNGIPLAQLLQAFLEAFDDQESASLGCAMNEPLGALEEDEPDLPLGYLPRPFALVFSVPGTQPDAPAMHNILTRSVPVKRARKRDSALEAARDKYVAGLFAMESELDVSVVVFDPWDYAPS